MDKHRWAMDDSNFTKRRFEAAVKVMRSLPEDGAYELSDDMLVMFYSYYKQATVGPCNTLKPNFWDPIGKDKWEAWKALGNMSKDQAMIEYVEEIQLIIETLPVTDRMAELMDALDPFYEIVEDDDDEATASKPALLSTGGTNGDKEDDAAGRDEEDESDSSVVNIEDDADMVEAGKDSSTLAAGEGGLHVFNGSEENSVSSSTNETHSSLNTEVQEEELVYSREPSTEPPEFCSSDYHSDDIILTKYKSHTDESDDELYSDSMEMPENPQKGSGVPRVHLADASAAEDNIKQRQGGNREVQCGSQDGKPQGVTSPVPHPPALGTVQTDRMSQSRGRVLCQLMETNLTEQSCQGDGEMEGSKDKQAFNSQIAVTLSQLQNNMQDVLQRLTTLEILTASQIESIPLENYRSKSPNQRLPWWPLDVSPISVVWAVMWPFAVHWLVQFYLQKRRRWLKCNPLK